MSLKRIVEVAKEVRNAWLWIAFMVGGVGLATALLAVKTFAAPIGGAAGFVLGIVLFYVIGGRPPEGLSVDVRLQSTIVTAALCGGSAALWQLVLTMLRGKGL